MATDNKKVSGYLPQYIFDVFEDFREKRSLSASSALIAILSEYFQVDQKVDHQIGLLSGNDFVSREQFEALEIKFSELSSSLPSELERMFSSLRSELLNILPKAIEPKTVNVESESLSELQDAPLSELLSKSQHEPLSELPSELQNQDKPLGILLSKPEENADQPTLTDLLAESTEKLSTKLLAKRLNIRSETISTFKKEKSEEEFYKWLQGKDPDTISWQPVGGSLKGYSKGWIPSDDTPNELLSRLEEWLLANPE